MSKTYHGKPCFRCKETLRWARDSDCVECSRMRGRQKYHEDVEKSREQRRKSYHKNKEKKLEYSRKYNELHKEWRLKYNRERYQRTKEHHASLTKRWREAHKDRCRFHCSKYRASKLQATPKWANQKEMEYVYSLTTEKGQVVDHMVPLQSDKVCGLNCEDNLRVIPEYLNKKKGNYYWPDMWDYT